MVRALIAIGALLLLAFAVLGAAVYFTRDEDSIAVDNLLAEDVSRAIGTAEDRGEPVDLAEVADFGWSEVLLVERGTPRREISRAIGSEWNGNLPFQTGDLLIFLDGSRVERHADYRGEGRFEGFRRPIARIARADAKFEVRALVVRPSA